MLEINSIIPIEFRTKVNNDIDEMAQLTN